MSHVAVIKIAVKSLECLKRAAEALGLELRLGQKTYQWYGEWVKDYHADDAAYKNGINPQDFGKCEHAIVDPNSDHRYEVGIINNPHDEGYLAIVDFFGMNRSGHICNKVGKHCEYLLHEYTAQVSLMESQDLIDQGWQVNGRELQEDGSTNLVLWAE